MRTVAILGGAPHTRDAVWQSSADEIWTMNWSYKYDYVPRIDRLFEMHPIWLYAGTDKPQWRKPREHWKWLQEKHPYPIYMLGQLPKIPSCVRYPIEQVTEHIFGGLLKGEKPSDFYTSSADYMLALAIFEEWDVIELYGIEMVADTEYRYQKEGVCFFIGFALAKGIVVKLQSNSVLMKAKKYGYEGGQMIFRQDLEAALAGYDKMRNEAVTRVQHTEGRIAEASRNGSDDKHLAELQQILESETRLALQASTAYQVTDYFIKHVDLEEPEMKLVDPLVKIGVK